MHCQILTAESLRKNIVQTITFDLQNSTIFRYKRNSSSIFANFFLVWWTLANNSLHTILPSRHNFSQNCASAELFGRPGTFWTPCIRLLMKCFLVQTLKKISTIRLLFYNVHNLKFIQKSLYNVLFQN